MPSTPAAPRFPHALVALGVAAALLVVAGTLSHLAGDAGPFYRGLREAMRDVPDWLWSDLTFFGFGLTAAVLVPMLRDRSMRFVAVSLWSFAFTTIGVQAVKRVLVTPRPMTLVPDLGAIGDRLMWGSMPSGHAATALAFATAFILVLSRSWWSVAIVLVLSAAVAVSRIGVGAHFVGDVLAGAGIGIGATALSFVAERRVDLARWLVTPAGQLAIAAIQLVTGTMMLWRPLGYPLAQPLQWVLGVAGIGAGLVRLWRMRATTTVTVTPTVTTIVPVARDGEVAR